MSRLSQQRTPSMQRHRGDNNSLASSRFDGLSRATGYQPFEPLFPPAPGQQPNPRSPWRNPEFSESPYEKVKEASKLRRLLWRWTCHGIDGCDDDNRRIKVKGCCRHRIERKVRKVRAVLGIGAREDESCDDAGCRCRCHGKQNEEEAWAAQVEELNEPYAARKVREAREAKEHSKAEAEAEERRLALLRRNQEDLARAGMADAKLAQKLDKIKSKSARAEAKINASHAQAEGGPDEFRNYMKAAQAHADRKYKEACALEKANRNAWAARTGPATGHSWFR